MRLCLSSDGEFTNNRILPMLLFAVKLFANKSIYELDTSVCYVFFFFYKVLGFIVAFKYIHITFLSYPSLQTLILTTE